MTLRALVFTGIDTIVHTRDARRRAFNEVFAEAGLDWHWDEPTFAALERAGHPVEEFIKRQKRWLETDDTQKLRVALQRHHKTTYLQKIVGAGTGRPGVTALIAAARDRGFKVALVSTFSDTETSDIVRAVLSASSAALFDVIVCRESIDQSRFESDSFATAVEALGVPPNAALAVCSGGGGSAAATAAGLGTLIVRRDVHDQEDHHDALAVVDELTRLPGVDSAATTAAGEALLEAVKTLHLTHCNNTIAMRVRASSNWTVFERGVKSMRVADILSAKGRGFISVRPEETLQDFAARLKQEKVGALIVSANGTSLDGIISERDLAFGLAVHGEALARMPVSALMTKTVITCQPNHTIAEVMSVMTQRRIRHLPVKDGDVVVGIISIGDVMKQRLDEMRLEANVLRDYAIARR